MIFMAGKSMVDFGKVVQFNDAAAEHSQRRAIRRERARVLPGESQRTHNVPGLSIMNDYAARSGVPVHVKSLYRDALHPVNVYGD